MVFVHDNNRRILVDGFYDEILSNLKIMEGTAFEFSEVVKLRL